MSDEYEDIIRLPHHVSRNHPQMPVRDRAAQFAPFAALAGYRDALRETARLTEDRIELSESDQDELNRRLCFLLDENFEDMPTVYITHFVPDMKKPGGAYVTVKGSVKRWDELDNTLQLMDGSSILIENILKIESTVFGD